MTDVTQVLLSFSDAPTALSNATGPSGILSGPEWSRLILTLVHSLWQGALLSVLLVIPLRFCAARRSQIRYVLCLTALAGLPGGCILTWSWLSHADASQSESVTEAMPAVAEFPLPDFPIQATANKAAHGPQSVVSETESRTDTTSKHRSTRCRWFRPLMASLTNRRPRLRTTSLRSPASGSLSLQASGWWVSR